MKIRSAVKPIYVALDDSDPSKGQVAIPFDRKQCSAFAAYVGAREKELSSRKPEDQIVSLLAYRTRVNGSDGVAVYRAQTMNGFFKEFASSPTKTRS
jgi:hypothetical protein